MTINATPPTKRATITDSRIIVDKSGSESKRQVLNTAINEIAITEVKRSPTLPKYIRQNNLIFGNIHTPQSI